MRNVCRTKYLKLCFMLYCGFYGAFSQNVTEKEIKESVMETIFDMFYHIIELSDNFQRFPINETYVDGKYMANTSQIPTDVHDGLLGVLLDYNVSQDCRHDILRVNDGLQKNEDWALRMIDSFGKPVSGLLDLKFKWLGSYDECVTAHAHKNFLTKLEFSIENVTGDSDIVGLYCKTTLPVPFSMVPESSSHLVREWFPAEVQFGGCFPDTCTEKDISQLVKAVADHVQGTTTKMSVHVECQQERHLTKGAIFVIILLVLIGIALTIGTGYDILYMRMKLFSKTETSSAEREETVQLNGLDSNGTAKTVNGTSGTLQIVNGEPVLINGATNEEIPYIDGSLSEHASLQDDVENVISEMEKLEIEAEVNFEEEKQMAVKDVESNLHILLMSFSVVKNAEVLLDTNVSANRVNAIEGLRALTMAWIITVHVLMYGGYYSDNVIHYVMENANDFTFLPMTSAGVCVDTFFTITGFLIMYLCLKKIKSLGGVKKFPWVYFYLCRIWRTSPTLYVVFLVYWLLWPQMSSGPMWDLAGPAKNCSNLWWQTMLYFNNFYGAETNGCFGGAWYLAVDLQLYMVSPVLIILFFLKPKIASILSGVSVLASAVYVGVVTHVGQLNLPMLAGPVNPSVYKVLLEYIHLYPFSHIAPFVIGLLTGYLVYRFKDTLKLTKRQTIIGWAICLTFLPLFVYGPIFIGPMDDRVRRYDALAVFFGATSKTGWALCVGWVIFACAIGKGGFINSLLSWSPFIVLGRLTFSTYLIHFNVLHVYFWTRRTLFHFTDTAVVFTATSMIMMSFAAAFIVAVCIELPSCALQKILLKKHKKFV